jgi:rhodanese-related sulfurtransferase
MATMPDETTPPVADTAAPAPSAGTATGVRPDPDDDAGPASRDGDAAIDQLLDEVRAGIEPRARPGELADVVARGGLVVDTRPYELRSRDGEMPGALIVDRNKLEWRLDPSCPWRLPEVTGSDQPIVVVCDEGYASSLAAATLRRLGLRHATDLAGGFQAWRHAGSPPLPSAPTRNP